MTTKNKTILEKTLRMVFPSAADRDFVVKEFGAIEGGQQTLERLGEHLARTLSKPFVISRLFDAPRELVWKAWTEREGLMSMRHATLQSMTKELQDAYRKVAPHPEQLST